MHLALKTTNSIFTGKIKMTLKSADQARQDSEYHYYYGLAKAAIEASINKGEYYAEVFYENTWAADEAVGELKHLGYDVTVREVNASIGRSSGVKLKISWN